MIHGTIVRYVEGLHTGVIHLTGTNNQHVTFDTSNCRRIIPGPRNPEFSGKSDNRRPLVGDKVVFLGDNTDGEYTRAALWGYRTAFKHAEAVIAARPVYKYVATFWQRDGRRYIGPIEIFRGGLVETYAALLDNKLSDTIAGIPFPVELTVTTKIVWMRSTDGGKTWKECGDPRCLD